MPKNQNTLACYLDKKTRTTQDVHFSAPSQLPKVTQTQATTPLELVAAFSEGEVHLTLYMWNSAVPLQCCGNCLHQRLCNSCFAACRRQCLRNYWP
ncbi:uncharacterized protein [Dermacentor andersoni]|uniref:uncharacterized protein isoform X3 n=1 Tax=Dermacentor andersoni TaxID=34620 RepID=UPI0024170D50|nr:uncharacterized protein LOC126535598 isoform X3 [Dermacentor andersoni]